MLCHSKNYYIYKETQELFEMKLVKTGGFTQKTIKWLFVYKFLKKQCYFYSQITIFRLILAINILVWLLNTWFYRVLYIDCYNFQYILWFIQTNSIFENKSNIFQAPVKDQIYYTLYKLE